MTHYEVMRDRAVAVILKNLFEGTTTQYKALCDAYDKGYSRGGSFRDPEAIGEEQDVLGNNLQTLMMLLERKHNAQPDAELERILDIFNVVSNHYHALMGILTAADIDKAG